MEDKNSTYYKPYLDSITEFMIKEGIELKPLPQVMISHEKQGDNPAAARTGCYDPENRVVTLFVNARHPKDVLRSFAHEMIHHNQNLRGENLMVTTETLGEDSNLDRLEEDAFSRGNICFRKWTQNHKGQNATRLNENQNRQFVIIY